MKRYFLISLISISILITFSGFKGGCSCEKDSPVSPSISKPIDTSKVRAVSFDYCALSRPYLDMLDMLSQYNVNGTRIFSYCGWDANYYPWKDETIDILDPEKIRILQVFVDEANRRGMTVILSLFQDNAGGGTEDIVRQDKGVLSRYIEGIVNALNGKVVIFETANEIGDIEFQKWVLTELKKYGVKTSSYYYSIGADYRSVHTIARKCEVDSNTIQSNDRPGLEGISNQDYINIAKDCKHIEFLFAWGRDLRPLLSPQDILAEYGEVLKSL